MLKGDQIFNRTHTRTKSSMAAEARHYEKSISYSSRQTDDKYIQKLHLSSRSRESSPYRLKSRANNHTSSPSGRKRPYDSPTFKHGSEVMLKKERRNKDYSPRTNNEWSKHMSSSGKTYFYNKRTEQSQWEAPRNEIKDTRSSGSSRDSRSSKDFRDDDYREFKDSNTRFKPRDYKDSKSYSREGKESFRDQWNRRDYHDGRSSLKDKRRDGNASRTRTTGQTTPTSSTVVNRSYQTTPDSELNGTLQDISPPGTPTNDDIPIILSSISPAPLCTPLRCSPLLNTSLSNIGTVHSPLLSPNTIPNQAFLHPLQQALLLKQQVVPVVLRENYTSPKLPTIKQHHNSGSTPTSPQISSLRKLPKASSSPCLVRSNSSTPPPPPPPRKEERRSNSYRSRTPEKDSSHSSERSRSRCAPSNHKEVHRLTKDALIEQSNAKKHLLDIDESLPLHELPTLERYLLGSQGAHIVDMATACLGSMLEKQASTCCDETMAYLQNDGYQSKFDLLITKLTCDVERYKTAVTDHRLAVLNSVTGKIESLQDSSMKADGMRTTRDYKTQVNRRKQETNTVSSPTTENVAKETLNGCMDTSECSDPLRDFFL